MIALLAVTTIKTPSVDWFAIAPEIALFSAALVIVLGRSLSRHDPRVHEASLLTAIVGVLCAGAFTLVQWNFVQNDGPYQAMLNHALHPGDQLVGMIAVDGFAVFAKMVVLIATLLALLLSSSYLKREHLEGPEYFALVLCSATGMMLMTSANDLVTIFLSLEILSIALYVLAAWDRRRLTSQESGLKYFLLGSFSSAVFLYGVALVYGATGTTNLTGIADFLAQTTLLHDGVLMLGIAFLIVGLGFKVAAAPFHMWTPDVYQGAPTPVTAFMAAATKAAAFAAVLRVLIGSFWLYSVDWRPIIWVLAVLSLLVGSIAAVVQSDVKRMLAYSSITHAGFVLIAVQAGTAKGTSAALFYVLTYALMTIGAFAIVGVVAHEHDDEHALSDYRGLAARQPVLAGLLTLFLLAQAGVPLTGGFVAKLSVFSAAVNVGQYPLAIVGMLASVIAAFVYLRIVLAMYSPTDDEALPDPASRALVDFGTRSALTLSAAGVLFLGIVPWGMLDFAKHATQLLTH
ncbi:MAG TPA: NADH-quinone oxidoreductase subunit N [Acidimicrobiia bacterium]|jgi:NADH-quinone oxidoreductase subunit N|nr:NADH-quinone oxidoreductase subunit N [Acidimicrobiia bacterium]